jgi:glycerol dehydrogenase
LVLENRDQDFLDDFFRFYRLLGLPCTLAGLGLKKVTTEYLQVIAERSCAEGSHMHKMAVPVDERRLIDAIVLVDAVGQETGS